MVVKSSEKLVILFWVCLKAVITEKTLIRGNQDSKIITITNNYNSIIVHTQQFTTFFNVSIFKTYIHITSCACITFVVITFAVLTCSSTTHGQVRQERTQQSCSQSSNSQ